MAKERKWVRVRPRNGQGELVAASDADHVFFTGRITRVGFNGEHIKISCIKNSMWRSRLLRPEPGKTGQAMAFIRARQRSHPPRTIVNDAYLAGLVQSHTKAKGQHVERLPATRMWDGGNMRIAIIDPRRSGKMKIRIKNDVLDATVSLTVRSGDAEQVKAAFLAAWAAIPRKELPRAITREWRAKVDEILLACGQRIDPTVGMLSRRFATTKSFVGLAEESAEVTTDVPEVTTVRSKKKQRRPFVPGAVGRARRSWSTEDDQAYLMTFHHQAVPALADGNCFYDAIAILLRNGMDHAAIRALGVNYLSEHLHEMAPGLTDEETVTCLDQACRNGEYVDHIMIASVSRALRKNIVILYSDQRNPLIQRHREGDEAALTADDTLVVYYYVPAHYEPAVPVPGKEAEARAWLAGLNTSPAVRIAREMPDAYATESITAAFQQLRKGGHSAASGVISPADQKLFLSADARWDEQLSLIESCQSGRSYSAEKYARCCSYLWEVLAKYQRLFESYRIDFLKAEMAEVRTSLQAVLEKREEIFSSSIGDDVLGEEGVDIQNWPAIEKHFARGVRFFPEETNPKGLRCVPHAQLPDQLGLRATQVIPAGTLIATYAGVPCADGDQHESSRYFFGHAEGGGGVDASRICNVAVLANHSAVNNCQAVYKANGHVEIRAAREVKPGEEMLYSYGPYYAFGSQPAFLNPYLGAHSPKWFHEQHKTQYKQHNGRLWPKLYLDCLRNRLARGEVLPMLPLLEINRENKFDAKLAQPCISPLHSKEVYRDEDCVKRFLAAGLPGDWLDIKSGKTPAFRMLADRELDEDKKYALLKILLVTNQDQLLLQDRDGNSILGLCVQLGLSDCLEWCVDQIKGHFEAFDAKVLCKMFFDPSHQRQVLGREDGEDGEEIRARYEQFVTQMTTGNSAVAKVFRTYETPEDTVQPMRRKGIWKAFDVLRPPLSQRDTSRLPKDDIKLFLAADEAWNQYEALWERYQSNSEYKPDIKDFDALLAQSKAGYAQLRKRYPHIKELGDEVHEVEQAQQRVAKYTASSSTDACEVLSDTAAAARPSHEKKRRDAPVATPALASMTALKRRRQAGSVACAGS